MRLRGEIEKKELIKGEEMYDEMLADEIMRFLSRLIDGIWMENLVGRLGWRRFAC